jgi:DNA-binding transcriptional LysR family regulator
LWYIDGMELRHLRYFVAVAEELHFGRAARRLNLAQPPLSQQIRGLESRLGITLFLRTSRKVELTEAGRLLLEQARLVLLQLEKAGQTMRAAQRGEAGRITIGFATAAVDSLVPAILREFNRTRPLVEIRCLEMNSEQQKVAFHERRIQVGFTRAQLTEASLQMETLIKEGFVMALPIDHPRVMQEKLRLEEFATEGFILFSRDHSAATYDAIIASCQQVGFSPRIAQEGGGLQTILALVAAGLGVAMVPASLRHLQRPGVIYRSLPPSDTQETTLSVVWRKDDRSPVVESLVKIALATARAAR